MPSRLRISDFGLRISLLVLLLAAPLAAQTPVASSAPTDDSLTVNVLSNRVGVGEIGQIFIKVRNGEATLPERIDVEGLDVTFSGQRSSINVVNAVSTVETTYFYRFRGDKPGTFTIPEFEIRIAGRGGERVARTRPLVITIVENDGSATAAVDATKPYFGKLELVRDTFYVNELVPFTLTAYVRGRNAIHDVVSASLEHESFVMKGFREVRTDGAEVGSSYYSSAVIPSHLFALKPGSHRLGPAQVAVRVLDSDSGFGFSSLFQRTVTREMVTNTASVTVKPLPSGAPASFTGGIGTFELSARPSITTLGVGDPVSMEFEVTGTGNLRTMAAPVLSVPQNDIWKTYEANKTLNDEEDSDGFRAGKVRFSQVLIPEARVESIPEFQLSYFDPTKEEYVTLKAGPFPITMTQTTAVETPAEASSPTEDPSPAAKRPEPSFSDVLHIRTGEPRWIAVGDLGKTGPLFWIVQALCSAAFCTVLGFGLARWLAVVRQRSAVLPETLPFSRAVKRLPPSGSSRLEFYHAVARALAAWRREHPDAPSQADEILGRVSERCDAVLYSGQADADGPIAAAEAEEFVQLLRRLPRR